jgi:RNA polymerase sigma-70 factor (ECF subfamily)
MPPEHELKESRGLFEEDQDERMLMREIQAYIDTRTRGWTPSAQLEEAWGRFFRLGRLVIRGSIRSWRLTPADREDCEQEFWAEVIAQLRQSRYDPSRAGIRTWLSALARHKSADAVRRRYRHAQLPLDDSSLRAIPSVEADPATAFEKLEAQTIVCHAMAALSQVTSDCSYRVLHLRSIEELEVPEVAAELGLTPDQVRFRHCRAKKDLRQIVETMLEAADAG